MRDPVISAVMPAHNGHRYIGAAIRSILAQSYGDFELIIVDDGSTDSTLARVRDAVGGDARVRLISREKRGLVASLNEGVAAAQGRWIARMDADDISHPLRFERQLAWCERHEADICGCWIEIFGRTIPKTRRFYIEDADSHFQLLFNTCFAHPTVFARHELLASHAYDEDAYHAEDYELWCRIASHGYRMTNVPERLLRYRIHAAQISQRKLREQYAQRRVIAGQYRERNYPAFPAAIHELFIQRGVLLSPERIAEVGHFMRDNLGNPGFRPDVLLHNYYIFLCRHAEAGLGSVARECGWAGFGAARSALPVFLALTGAHQQSRLFNWLHALR